MHHGLTGDGGPCLRGVVLTHFRQSTFQMLIWLKNGNQNFWVENEFFSKEDHSKIRLGKFQRNDFGLPKPKARGYPPMHCFPLFNLCLHLSSYIHLPVPWSISAIACITISLCLYLFLPASLHLCVLPYASLQTLPFTHLPQLNQFFRLHAHRLLKSRLRQWSDIWPLRMGRWNKPDRRHRHRRRHHRRQHQQINGRSSSIQYNAILFIAHDKNKDREVSADTAATEIYYMVGLLNLE